MLVRSNNQGERASRILVELDAGRDQIAQELVGAMRREIPEYAALLGRGGPGDRAGTASAAFAREVAEHALDHVEGFLRTARTGRAPTGEELEFVRVRAAQRARELLPLEALLQAYLLGQRTFWEALVAAAGDELEDLRALTGLTAASFTYTHAISAAAAETYTHVRQRTVADRDRARRDLLDMLLAGSGPLPEEHARRAQQLGLEAEAELVVVVAAVADSGGAVGAAERLRLVSEAVAWHAARDAGAAFVVPRHDEVVALLPAATQRPEQVRAALERGAAHLQRTHGATLRAGVSTRCAGPAEAGRGYREAQQALRHAGPGRPAVALEEVGLLEHLTATADPTSVRLVGAAVRRLAREPVLVETLRAYADADLNVTECARRLAVHPNTVHYRLGRVQEFSGRDPRRFGDLAELLTGLTLVSARSSG